MFVKSSFCEAGACPEVNFVKSSFCDASTCPEVGYVKSSFCDSNSCPEIHTTEDVVLFRDSEDPDTVVKIKPESWRTFVAGVKAGEFDV
jgi:hypothetical protein